MARYTDAQIEWVKENLSEMLHFFGYAKVTTQADNPTGYFDYGSTSDEQL